MTNTAENLRSYGEGDVYVAPKGSTAPTDATTDLDAAFKPLGWLSPDQGLTQSQQLSTNVVRGWNAGAILRTLKSNQGYTMRFQCLEENARVLGLLYPGATVSTDGGVNERVVKTFTGQDLRAWVFQLKDGDVNLRKYAPSGEVTGFGDVVYKDNDITVYQFTVTIYADSNGDFFTEWDDNDADVSSSSSS